LPALEPQLSAATAGSEPNLQGLEQSPPKEKVTSPAALVQLPRLNIVNAIAA
jgi:hypothetical protein